MNNIRCYDIDGNIVTGVTFKFNFNKVSNYSSHDESHINHIDVIKPYNGKYAYFKYRAIFFMIQTICQTYSDIEYESLCVILARNALNIIKDIK